MSKANTLEYKKFKDHPARDVNLLKGRKGHLTSKEKKVLKKIVDTFDWENEYANFLIPGEHPETCALRWCRARDFDSAEVEKMIRNHLTWRISFDIDKKAATSYNDLLGLDLEKEVLPLYPQGFCGEDRCGRLVYVKQVGKLDVTKLLTKIDVDTFVNFEVAMMERSKWLNGVQRARKKHHVEEYFSIIDLEGFGMSMMKPSVWEFMRTIASQLGDNYPEQNGGMYIINSPWVFKMVWRVVTTFVDAATCAKIKILGSDYKKVLLSKVDKEYLPKEYGGTGPSVDEVCLKYGKYVYTPEARPTASEALRGSFEYIKSLDENRDDVTDPPPQKPLSPTSKLSSSSRMQRDYEDTKEDISPLQQSLNRKNEKLESEVKTSNELKTSNEVKGVSEDDDYVMVDETKNIAHANTTPAVPILNKQATKKMNWKKVRKIAIGDKPKMDLASIVTVKSTVEKRMSVTSDQESKGISNNNRDDNELDSKYNTNITIENNNSNNYTRRTHSTAVAATTTTVVTAPTITFRNTVKEELTSDDDDEDSNHHDSEDEYEDAKNKLLNEFTVEDDDDIFLVLEDNNVNPIDHPILQEPWDIKDNDVDRNNRGCASDAFDCIIS